VSAVSEESAVSDVSAGPEVDVGVALDFELLELPHATPTNDNRQTRIAPLIRVRLKLTGAHYDVVARYAPAVIASCAILEGVYYGIT
jgi:hypothetical protein